jgi:predicted nucleotidyltransferase
MVTKDEILSFLKANKTYLHEHFHVEQIGIFGSFARNEANEQSDIDFLVVIDNYVSNYRETKSELREYLAKQFDRKVDLANPESLKPHFKDRILKQAIYA